MLVWHSCQNLARVCRADSTWCALEKRDQALFTLSPECRDKDFASSVALPRMCSANCLVCPATKNEKFWTLISQSETVWLCLRTCLYKVTTTDLLPFCPPTMTTFANASVYSTAWGDHDFFFDSLYIPVCTRWRRPTHFFPCALQVVIAALCDAIWKNDMVSTLCCVTRVLYIACLNWALYRVKERDLCFMWYDLDKWFFKSECAVWLVSIACDTIFVV